MNFSRKNNMQILNEVINQEVTLNPMEEIEVTTDLGVIEQVCVTCFEIDEKPAALETQEVKNIDGIELYPSTREVRKMVPFGFSSGEVIQDISSDQISLRGVQLMSFKVKNPNMFTVKAMIGYSAKA